MRETETAIEVGGVSFEQLKMALKARIPEGAQLSVSEVMEAEALIALAFEVAGPEADIPRANLLLSNYHLLRPERIGAKGHLMQMARRHLLRLSSTSNWHKRLERYQKPELDEVRLYELDGDHAIPEDGTLLAKSRPALYLEWLRTPASAKGAITKARPGSRYRYYPKHEKTETARDDNHASCHITIPENIPSASDAPVHADHKGPREPIEVTLEELISTAHHIGEKTGKAHYASVLERVSEQGLLKRVFTAKSQPTDYLRLEQVTNLVGLVGSGKSALADTLVVALANRGYRILVLLNSVSDVMESVSFLRKTDIVASPLVSKSRRVSHLDEIVDREGTMLLDDTVARYLETSCLIDGLSSEEAVCSYASTPCHALYNGKPDPRTCPFWDICPSQSMARDALTSQVVVTTPSGFAMMTVGSERSAFFEHVLADFDLAIFDEADRVQAQLDGNFAPEINFHDLIYRSADPTAQAMKRDPADKMQNLDEELFFDLRQSSEPVAKALLLSLKNAEISSWGIAKNEAFTSLSLLEDLEGQGLPTAIAKDLETRLTGRTPQGTRPPLDQVVALSCQGIDESTFQFALDEYLDNAFAARGPLDSTLRERLAFLLKVIRFDEYLQQLADISDSLSFRDESVTELYNFLRFSHVRQQRYLPSSLIGNVFGLRMSADGNSLDLFRQFAFGRAFMNALPWLDTDTEGKPMGPHVLLLSGSSYEPGCLQYHVNRPVDYLLEAQSWIQEKLACSTVCDLGIEQAVSGSGGKFRTEHLNIVLSALMSTLCTELDTPNAGKMLVIVNSYREAEQARETLEAQFRKRGRADKVCGLVQDPREDSSRFMPRSEVYRFAEHPARILVAPALAIERGFNIVDGSGHATFSTLVFSVRPMGDPHDLKSRYRKLNGRIEDEIDQFPEDPFEFVRSVRTRSWAVWKELERSERVPLSALRAAGNNAVADDVIATLMVTVVQLFGRLARLRDPERPAPHVYFADAAFRGPTAENGTGFRTLEELGNYLRRLIEESDQPAVAKALYGPFYEAFEKGIS